ncbi:hypothetical protein SAMN03159341_11540 [Paenibacillus sp. 1_12]|uniref:hypothetical protein n=1 Tax=Paenibacillus sp. 1_12 TaxID=1566278 RepID=UPI0008EB744C|nr:hypothetical protein [Paenibacillus sp. 1_12]SFM05803.1 hypothetical protein SAMN03159341_11540 [Paenibacillus sp. 1_12]
MSDLILQQILTELKEIKVEQVNTTQRFDRLENRFDALEIRFDTLENRFDALEGRFDGLEQKVESNSKDISDIKVIMATLATKEDVKEIPFIRQAVLEINERLKQNETGIGNHAEAIIDHGHQFNIVNKRIFALESDVDRLKNK